MGAGCGREPPTSLGGDAAAHDLDGSAGKATPPIQWLAHPRVFASGAHLGAIAVTPQLMLATTVGPAPAKLVAIDARGNMRPLAPEFVAPEEVVCHLAVSPGLREGFPDDDVFVSFGPDLWRLRATDQEVDVVTRFLEPHGDIAGMCFDTTGDFRNDLLVLTHTGSVFRVGPDYQPTAIGSFGAAGRGPSVLASRKGARLIAAFPASGAVRAMDAQGAVSAVGGWSGVSAALAFPQRTFAYAGTGAALFVATSNGQVLMFGLSDVGRRAGSLLLTSMHASGSGLATPTGPYYQLDAWSRHRGPEVAAAFVQLPAVLKVAVAVAPDLNGGPLTLNDPSPVRIALLGAPWFEAAWVDATSLRCAGAAPVGNRKRAAFDFVDVNDDGDVDMVMSFRPSEMDIDVSTTTVTMTGQTLAGDALRGVASVRVSSRGLAAQQLRTRRGIPAAAP